MTFAAFLLILLVSIPQAAAPSAQADRIVVFKKEHKMQLLRGEKVLRTYRISLGSEPVGPKQRQGDHKTPEGHYTIDRRNPRSKFHLALHVSYPNADDRKRAAAAGYEPGGDIMIHGLPSGYAWIGAGQRLADWTDGCIAVTNKEIEEIWALVPDGTPVEIKP